MSLAVSSLEARGLKGTVAGRLPGRRRASRRQSSPDSPLALKSLHVP
ncbi:MAG: hypothetical protein LBW85_02250 [Deltaproteobacteria bacterium]|nr:hypothetical protein [Deltaproteobacteria bacterium]